MRANEAITGHCWYCAVHMKAVMKNKRTLGKLYMGNGEKVGSGRRLFYNELAVFKGSSSTCKERKALKVKHRQNNLCLYIKGAQVQKLLSVLGQKHRSSAH